MKAITLWEPWATAMALGRKRNETRSWPTQHRGDLVICAAKRRMDIPQVHLMMNVVQPPPGYEVPYGHAVCVVRLYACQTTRSVAANALEVMLGDYSEGRWAWLTCDLRPLRRPVPVKGMQGIFELSPGEEADVRMGMAYFKTTTNQEKGT